MEHIISYNKHILTCTSIDEVFTERRGSKFWIDIRVLFSQFCIFLINPSLCLESKTMLKTARKQIV